MTARLETSSDRLVPCWVCPKWYPSKPKTRKSMIVKIMSYSRILEGCRLTIDSFN